MSWTILIGLVLSLTLAVIVVAFRRHELLRHAERVHELRDARERGTNKARLSYPHVDLSRCLGCGACIRACPEEGVLALIHGQAIVVHGARCVGHGRCATECPTGAIALTLGDLESRRDIPVLDERFESPGEPGLFLGGEVTGYALIRTAIAHGTAIADEVARRTDSSPRGAAREVDLCIVGAGPAGLACSLKAKELGLRFVTLEQDELGGTVAKYPRKKLVMTEPVDLPLHGRLEKSTYLKEELIELWKSIAAEHELPIHTGVHFLGLTRAPDDAFVVSTDRGNLRARHVALTLGRRGTPRRLEVVGEELAKVSYGLIDAQAFQGRRILVVGGGDSAVEAALALAEQPGNEVTLSYRQPAFFRLKRRNEERIEQALAENTIRVLFESQVLRIGADAVELRIPGPNGPYIASLPNDEVFVLVGGVAPFGLLEKCGISFDPAGHAAAAVPIERGTGLLRALAVALAFSFVALAWIVRYSSYYLLPAALRPSSAVHDWLSPSSGLGLALGVGAAALIALNLAYLLRRNNWFGLRWGALKSWMTVHVLTGVLALLFAVVHGAMSSQDTLGYRTLAALSLVVFTGAIGRYVYSWVPRAANGRELELGELRAELAALASEWDRENRDFGEHVRAEVQRLVTHMESQHSLLRRLCGLFTAPRGLRNALARLRAEGMARGLSPAQIQRLMTLARRAHRTASVAAHFEDLRGLIGSWRYLHRWVALFLVLILALHVVVALRYGGLLS